MNDLNKLREQINLIDKEMLNLFEKRMNLSKQVAKYKKDNNLPILNKERENEVINNNKELLINKEYSLYYEKFIKTLMDISKEYQSKLMEEE